MNTKYVSLLIHALVLALFLPGLIAPAAAQQIDAAQLREDIEFVRRSIAGAHPRLGASTDPDTLNQALDAMAHDLPAQMTRDQAWQRLATLNPLLADAHLFIGYPDWRGESAAYLKAGGSLFPFEVDVGTDTSLSIRAQLGGGATRLRGAQVLAIDGVPAEREVAALSKLVHGDTPLFRADLLAQRWWLYHWKTYGAAPRYRLRLRQGGKEWTAEVPASAQTPAVQQDAADFDRQFELQIVPACAAVLRVGSFDEAFKDRFVAFAQAAFARLRQQGVDTLLVDIGANGGGDDALWLDGLMPYLATQPYRTGSTYVKRTAEGQAVDGSIETWRAPQPDNPLLFKGKVYVRLGPSTYSSAVLFANVMHDFGFATLTGKGGAARRTQSGGIRKYLLPNTGLALWIPRFILAPPGGEQRDRLLTQDVDLERLPVAACLGQAPSQSSSGPAHVPAGVQR